MRVVRSPSHERVRRAGSRSARFTGRFRETKPGELSRSRVANAIPSRFPRNSPQHCSIGASVRITFNDGKSLTHGPRVRLRTIKRLRLALIALQRMRIARINWTTQPGTFPTIP